MAAMKNMKNTAQYQQELIAMNERDNAWLDSLFASIDSRDTSAFVSHLTPNAEFIFGNMQPVSGQEQIASQVEGFFQSIRGLHHVLLEHWRCDDTLICRGMVTYLRHDGHEVVLPFANFMKRDGQLACKYQIYGDVSPIYAPAS